jgi:hypothetical protein
MGSKVKETSDVLEIIGSDTESARPLYLSQYYSLEKPGESEFIADAGLDPLFLKFYSEKSPLIYAYEIRNTRRKFIRYLPVPEIAGPTQLVE